MFSFTKKIEGNEGGDSNAGQQEELQKQHEGLNMILDYIIANKQNALASYLTESSKQELISAARHQLEIRNFDSDLQERIMNMFTTYLWGYYILEPLLNDPDISDIKCYGSDHICYKKKGERYISDIHFADSSDYERFVNMVAVKNKRSLSNMNALQTFMDMSSNPNARLRFCVVTSFLSDIEETYLSIRKIPTVKYSIDGLVAAGMLTEKQKDYLKDKARHASGILFTGKGASGKSTLMNAMLEEIPHNKSGAVFQENSELFTFPVEAGGHPDIMFQHIVETKGEGRISYSLEDLARLGLVEDLDYYIIGEIKGREAANFMMASFTGHKCWTSSHGKDTVDGIYKLADYVQQATSYSMEESLKMLSGLSVVLFLENFKLKEVTEIDGFDHETGELVTKKVEF